MSTSDTPHDDLAGKMEQVALEDPPTDIPSSRDITKAQIKRQVEYYFSDENLATDKFLIHRMKGNKNKPIALEKIHTFKKMRGFSPFSLVVEAVKESELLSVVLVNGKECVQRSIPFTGPGSESKPKPTGFEENWTEAPITPEEYAEDRRQYDIVERSFYERMETALYIYRSKRRFLPRINHIFNKFLAFGGVDTGTKQYSGGIDKDAIENNDTNEMARLNAIDFIGEDKFATGPGEPWDVDFEAVAKGFLSSQVPLIFAPTSEAEVKQIVNVLRNFYNYLLLHDVCPEYTDSILAARRICTVGERELKLAARAIRLLPGNFQMACSTLFGGHFQSMHVEDQEWYQPFKAAGEQSRYMSDDRAKQVYLSALSAPGIDSLFKEQKYVVDEQCRFAQQIVRTEERLGLEIIQIVEPLNVLENTGCEHGTPQLGRLVCKHWELPTYASFDKPAAGPPSLGSSDEYVFAVEQNVLDVVCMGMKMETTVHTLTSGLRFLDNTLAIYCSFYTLLYNEVLQERKKAKKFPKQE